jgi:photosystem II stability/assembly factor-like uncharacterized protein
MLRQAVGLFAVALIAVSPHLQAATPPAAIVSSKAHKSLLLDVTAAGKRLVAVGERGHIVLSDDAGKSWRQVAVPVRSLLTAVFFIDDKRGWAVGHDSVVLASTDAGNSWSLQHYKEFNPEALLEPVPEASEEEMADEVYEEEFVEEEAGRAVGSREGVPLLDVWFADADNGLAVGAYGLLLRTRDGGKSWLDESSTISNLEGWHLNAVAGLAGGVVIIGGEKGTLYRSADAGASFAPAISPYQGSFFGAFASSDQSIYVFGLQGSVYRSSDAGVSWSVVDTGITSGLNDACETPTGLRITGNAGVLLALDEGGSARVERRADRQSVLSCIATGNSLVVVGEGGAKFHPSNP